MPHVFEMFLYDNACEGKNVYAGDTPIDQDIVYDNRGLREGCGCMEGLFSNSLIERGLEKQYVCLSSKDMCNPERDVMHDSKDHFLWIDTKLQRGILNMHSYKPVALKLVPTNFDKTSNIFAETTYYVCDEGKCVKNSDADDLAFWWLKPGTQILCSDDTAQLGDIAIATHRFVAHMRPMDTGFGSIAQCIRPYDFSCVPVLEKTRRLYVALMYEYARELAKLGLPPELRRLVMQKSGRLEYARNIPDTAADLKYFKGEWDRLFERYAKDWKDARISVLSRHMTRDRLCEYRWDIPKFAAYCVHGDEDDKEQMNSPWEPYPKLFSVDELVKYKVLDPKLDCLVCFRPLVEHQKVCVAVSI